MYFRAVIPLLLLLCLQCVTGHQVAHSMVRTPTHRFGRSNSLKTRGGINAEIKIPQVPLKGECISQDNQSGKELKLSFRGWALATWGVLGVLAILSNAIKRLLPIALQPFYSEDLTRMQWIAYSTWAIFMAYVEGYKGFHQKFSALVVKRAFMLDENVGIINVALAWAYSMGIISATRKRMIISWSISAGVMGLVILVKNLTYPWRSIVDAGVVAGLTIGSFSILYHYARALGGIFPDIDPCLVPVEVKKPVE